MKKRILLAAVLLPMALAGCSGKVSDKYVTVSEYEGVEVEKVEPSETTEEEIDKVVARMMEGYTAQHDLPEDTSITDEIVSFRQAGTCGRSPCGQIWAEAKRRGLPDST